MDKIQVQTPKGRCEKLQSVDPARRGRSNVSLIYLLQRPRVSPNYVRGALVKLSTKKNRFPHTFSKASCSGMQLFRSSRGRVQPPLLDAHTFRPKNGVVAYPGNAHGCNYLVMNSFVRKTKWSIAKFIVAMVMVVMGDTCVQSITAIHTIIRLL